MNIYYYANQVYQYANIKPVFTQTGGTFVVNKLNRFLRFKFYMANAATNSTENRFLNTPDVIIRDLRKKLDLKGVIVSCSNTIIKNNKDTSISIFIGHGAGDKKYGGSAHCLETYDYHFISGDKHLHKINDALDKILIRENRMKLYEDTIKFVQTRVDLDLASFKEDIWSH